MKDSTIQKFMDVLFFRKPGRFCEVLDEQVDKYDEEEREVDVKIIEQRIYLEFNSDFYDFCNWLYTICDNRGLRYKVETERHSNTTYFQIVKSW